MLAHRESSVSSQPEPEGPSPPEKKPRITMSVSDEKESPVEIPVQGFQSFISGLNFHSGCIVNFNIHK